MIKLTFKGFPGDNSPKSNVESTYGAAGSIIVILLWIYYSAMILYPGAAFTKEYEQHFGQRIYPSHAVWVKKVEVDGQNHLREVERASDKGRIKPK